MANDITWVELQEKKGTKNAGGTTTPTGSGSGNGGMTPTPTGDGDEGWTIGNHTENKRGHNGLAFFVPFLMGKMGLMGKVGGDGFCCHDMATYITKKGASIETPL